MNDEQVKKFIEESRKAGVKDDDIVSFLQSKGFDISGNQAQPPVKAVNEVMTGLPSAPFQATGEEGVLAGAAKAAGNLPRSAFELGKSVFKAVTRPVETVKSLGRVVKGAGAKTGELLIENTDIGQQLLEKANANRVQAGLEPLKRDASGKLQAEDTPDLQAFNQVAQFFADRYGSLDKIKETAIEDPAAVLADVATILTGGGAAASRIGQASKIGGVARAGQNLSRLGQQLEPINAVTSGASKLSSGLQNTLAGRVASEAIPTAKGLQQGQVVKALDLTQGDLANIGKSTGNDVTEFMSKNNLLRNTPEEVATALNDSRAATMKQVRDYVADVKRLYSPEDIPAIKPSLQSILDDIDGVTGLEQSAADIKQLLQKDSFTLGDVQLAKELIDENTNLYSKIGDVKSTSKARGLANNRKSIQKFIEDEVSLETGGTVDIRQLNNDVATSYAIEDAILTRATRNLTRQNVSLGDWAAIFAGSTISPAVGIGLYIGKKLVQTPSFRLAFVKALNARPAKVIQRVLKEVRTNTVSPETQKIIDALADEARNNLQVIESGSKTIDTTTTEQTQ